MQSQKIYVKILRSLTSYERVLQASSEETFTCPSDSGGWSRSQVFSHVFGVNGWILAKVEDWPNNTYEQSKRQPLLVRLIFFLGTLGPKKIKAPKVIQDQVSLLSKKEASDLLRKVQSTSAQSNAHLRLYSLESRLESSYDGISFGPSMVSVD